MKSDDFFPPTHAGKLLNLLRSSPWMDRVLLKQCSGRLATNYIHLKWRLVISNLHLDIAVSVDHWGN
jgi:hypothetical protein